MFTRTLIFECWARLKTPITNLWYEMQCNLIVILVQLNINNTWTRDASNIIAIRSLSNKSEQISHRHWDLKPVLPHPCVPTSTMSKIDCNSGNIREILIFANFARSTNKNLAKIITVIALLKKNENSRILEIVKSRKIRNSRKFKHANISRSTVLYPSKHETLIHCCFNVGPTSKTAGQH